MGMGRVATVAFAVDVSREQSFHFPEDWTLVKALGTLVLEHLHSGMKIFPTSLVATALLQQHEGVQWGEMTNFGTQE